jgi:hypothetical protein
MRGSLQQSLLLLTVAKVLYNVLFAIRIPETASADRFLSCSDLVTSTDGSRILGYLVIHIEVLEEVVAPPEALGATFT